MVWCVCKGFNIWSLSCNEGTDGFTLAAGEVPAVSPGPYTTAAPFRRKKWAQRRKNLEPDDAIIFDRFLTKPLWLRCPIKSWNCFFKKRMNAQIWILHQKNLRYILTLNTSFQILTHVIFICIFIFLSETIDIKVASRVYPLLHVVKKTCKFHLYQCLDRILR